MPAIPNQARKVREYPLADEQDFNEGAFVFLINGTIQECGDDPAAILGVALHNAGALPLEDDILVAVAAARSTFIIQGSAPPVPSDVGVAYGISRDSDGMWYLDKDKTGTAARLLVERTFPEFERNQYEVSVLVLFRQIDLPIPVGPSS